MGLLSIYNTIFITSEGDIDFYKKYAQCFFIKLLLHGHHSSDGNFEKAITVSSTDFILKKESIFVGYSLGSIYIENTAVSSNL
jgi:hypothetical protein